MNVWPIECPRWEKVNGIYQYFGDSMYRASVAKKKIRDNREKERYKEK